MTSTGHALVGALLAAKFQNPALAIGLSLVSHYPLDILPHWDVGTDMDKRKKSATIIFALADIVLGLLLGYLLYSYLAEDLNIIVLLLSIFAAQLPDWLASPYYILNWKFQPFTWIEEQSNKMHKKAPASWGIASQVGVVFLIYIVLFLIF